MTLSGLAAGVADWFGREPVLDFVDWAGVRVAGSRPSTRRPPASTPSAASPPASPGAVRYWATSPGSARSTRCTRRWSGWSRPARWMWAARPSSRVRPAGLTRAPPGCHTGSSGRPTAAGVRVDGGPSRASAVMTMNGPEPDDVIGTEDLGAFEDFVEAAADRLLAAAELLTGPARHRPAGQRAGAGAPAAGGGSPGGPRPGAAGAADAGPCLGPARPAGPGRAGSARRGQGRPAPPSRASGPRQANRRGGSAGVLGSAWLRCCWRWPPGTPGTCGAGRWPAAWPGWWCWPGRLAGHQRAARRAAASRDAPVPPGDNGVAVTADLRRVGAGLGARAVPGRPAGAPGGRDHTAGMPGRQQRPAVPALADAERARRAGVVHVRRNTGGLGGQPPAGLRPAVRAGRSHRDPGRPARGGAGHRPGAGAVPLPARL